MVIIIPYTDYVCKGIVRQIAVVFISGLIVAFILPILETGSTDYPNQKGTSATKS